MPDPMADALAAHIAAVEAARDELPLLAKIADEIADRLKAGGTLYLLGNGGSAADAQHIAAELVGRFKQDRRALPAVALTTDTSALTAIANDLGADVIFARQVEAHVTDADAVWALSVSGTSPNVIAAMKAAAKTKALRIGMTGKNGDALAELCHHCFKANHGQSDRVQEIHVLAYHLICERIEARFVGS